MVKRVRPEEMIEFHDDEAKALADETCYGQGTPIEARIANAIIENAANIKAQNKGMSKFIQKMGEGTKLIAECTASYEQSGKTIQSLCDSVEKIAEDLDAGISTAEKVVESIAREVSHSTDVTIRMSVRESVRKTVKETNAEAEDRMNAASEKIEELVERNQKELEGIAAKVDETLHAAKLASFHPIVHFALAFALAVSIVTSMATYAVLQPVVSGEAQIVYVG